MNNHFQILIGLLRLLLNIFLYYFETLKLSQCCCVGVFGIFKVTWFTFSFFCVLRQITECFITYKHLLSELLDILVLWNIEVLCSKQLSNWRHYMCHLEKGDNGRWQGCAPRCLVRKDPGLFHTVSRGNHRERGRTLLCKLRRQTDFLSFGCRTVSFMSPDLCCFLC